MMPPKVNHIAATESTPEFLLDPSGFIKIKGRGISRECPELIDTVAEWIDAYVRKPAEVTYVDICCEYMNSYITSFIMSVLRKLSSIELKGYKVSFNWYYEDGDEDMLERGEFMSSSLNVDFVFIRYHERILCA